MAITICNCAVCEKNSIRNACALWAEKHAFVKIVYPTVIEWLVLFTQFSIVKFFQFIINI